MTLDEIRQFYAEEIRAAAPLRHPAVVQAFAHVPREHFLGPGPWQIAQGDMGAGATYLATEDAHARHIYHNVSVALDANRHLINGQPATLGRWIDELAIEPGERVYHLGCGVGYYTAILAAVTHTTGQVLASEFDEQLAARAGNNLSAYPNVSVHAGDGAQLDPGPCDAMLINAGVTLPLPLWLDRLKDGGRMIIPLTVSMGPTLGKGVVAKITRENDSFSSRALGLTVIYNCASARNPDLEPALGKAMATGALMRITSVRRDPHVPDTACILHTADLCLSSARPTAAQASLQ
jgi:protein-L-isoaspartate(D-aspartate) O-methyltransferase